MKRAAVKLMFVTLVLTFALPLTFSACAIFGGGAAPTLERVKGYSLIPPAGWTATDAEGESDEAYRLSSGAIATVTSSCGRNSKHTPEVLTKQLLIGARSVRVTKREKLVVAGKSALQSSVKAKLESVPFNLELIVVASSPCAFDFSLVSPKDIPEVERSQFVEYAKSLKYGTN